MSNFNRHPAGAPSSTGGRFAPGTRCEAEIDLTASYQSPPPGSVSGGPDTPWALRPYKWPANPWVPDVDGYATDDGFLAKPCWLQRDGERRVGWAVRGPGRDLPVHVDSAEEAKRWMKDIQDAHYRDLDAQRFPCAGPGRFDSTSSLRRAAAARCREGTQEWRQEMRAALAHLEQFRPGDEVLWTDEQARVRAGRIESTGRSDGAYGSWESYGVMVEYPIANGTTRQRINCHALASAQAGLRKAQDEEEQR